LINIITLRTNRVFVSTYNIFTINAYEKDNDLLICFRVFTLISGDELGNERKDSS